MDEAPGFGRFRSCANGNDAMTAESEFDTEPGRLAPMSELSIKSGRRSEVMQDDRRADLQDLQRKLEERGTSVDLEITEYVPGVRGLTWWEVVGIFIGLEVAKTAIDTLVGDTLETARDWAIARFKRTNGHRGIWVTIYGPDNRPLKTVKVDKDGAHEEDPGEDS
jgi:hypothetical protein